MGSTLSGFGGHMLNIKVNIESALVKLQERLDILEKFREQGNIDSHTFINIRADIENLLNEIMEDKAVSIEFNSETLVMENTFSSINTKQNISKAAERGINFLKRLIWQISNSQNSSNNANNSEFTLDAAKLIIRKILNNFYKHIDVMYNSNVHGNGKILKENLDKIKIGNEYDVQRILYALIKPIFPLARVEVSDNTGYSMIRYDIIIEQYNMIIEVKCTRDK